MAVKMKWRHAVSIGARRDAEKNARSKVALTVLIDMTPAPSFSGGHARGRVPVAEAGASEESAGGVQH